MKGEQSQGSEHDLNYKDMDSKDGFWYIETEKGRWKNKETDWQMEQLIERQIHKQAGRYKYRQKQDTLNDRQTGS